MTVKELKEKIKTCADDTIVLFSNDNRDFRDLDNEGHNISTLLICDTGTTKYLVLSD